MYYEVRKVLVVGVFVPGGNDKPVRP